MDQLTVALIKHVLLHVTRSCEPLPLLIAPQAHVTLANLRQVSSHSKATFDTIVSQLGPNLS